MTRCQESVNKKSETRRDRISVGENLLREKHRSVRQTTLHEIWHFGKEINLSNNNP